MLVGHLVDLGFGEEEKKNSVDRIRIRGNENSFSTDFNWVYLFSLEGEIDRGRKDFYLLFSGRKRKRGYARIFVAKS